MTNSHDNQTDAITLLRRKAADLWHAAIRQGLHGTLSPLVLEDRRAFEALRAWQQELYQAELIGLCWPGQFGGYDKDPECQLAVGRTLMSVGAADVADVVGLSLAGPLILEYGTEIQKLSLLRPMLEASHIWTCGLYRLSSPSMVPCPALQARVEKDGVIVNGMIRCPPVAAFATHGLVLAGERMESSLLLIPLDLQGIRREPCHDVTGLVFDDVHVPSQNILGAPGAGEDILEAGLMRCASLNGGAMGLPLLFDSMLRRCRDYGQRSLRDGRPAWEEHELRLQYVSLAMELRFMILYAFRPYAPQQQEVLMHPLMGGRGTMLCLRELGNMVRRLQGPGMMGMMEGDALLQELEQEVQRLLDMMRGWWNEDHRFRYRESALKTKGLSGMV